mmetsp:Transcript_170201/g.545822  ORF Transcript_170201/g.545822 Transcript_170201/m.545822 type:complete len:278 (+) Transcript_170201:1694-2527(+)
MPMAALSTCITSEESLPSSRPTGGRRSGGARATAARALSWSSAAARRAQRAADHSLAQRRLQFSTMAIDNPSRNAQWLQSPSDAVLAQMARPKDSPSCRARCAPRSRVASTSEPKPPARTHSTSTAQAARSGQSTASNDPLPAADGGSDGDGDTAAAAQDDGANDREGGDGVGKAEAEVGEAASASVSGEAAAARRWKARQARTTSGEPSATIWPCSRSSTRSKRRIRSGRSGGITKIRVLSRSRSPSNKSSNTCWASGSGRAFSGSSSNTRPGASM